MAFRVDTAGQLRPPRRLPDGRLRVDASLTRTGVFTYRNPDGSIRREYRADAEVFSDESLASFEGAPVTDDHPKQMLTAETATRHARGALLGVPTRDGNDVIAPMVVFDAALIKKMERGKVQVSCGYECDLVEESGVTPEGERYDARQTNIRGNHVAIVDAGRAGTARVRMDAASVQTDEGNIMDELKEALEKLALATERADKAESTLAEMQAAIAAEKARADSAERDLESERKARTDAAERFEGAVAARVALQTEAAPVLGADYVFAGKSDKEVRIAVIKKVDSDDVDAEAHDEYVAGLYRGAIKRAQKADAAFAGVREAIAAGRADGAADDTEKKAQAAMVERERNAWKNTGVK